MKFGKKQFFVVIIALTIGFIWSNSLQVADVSMEQSNFIKELVLSFFAFFGIDIKNTFFIDFIRKFAHFFEYFVLGLELIVYKQSYYKNSKKAFWVIVLIGIFVASVDETIQLIPSLQRSGQFLDVCIDSIGLILAMLLVNGIFKIQNRNKN